MKRIIRISYGMQSIEKDFDGAQPTYHSIITDPNLKALFGWGDNLRAMVDGVEQQPLSVIPASVTEVEIETKANTKAS